MIYVAKNIPVLTFSNAEQDDFGTIIPVLAEADFPAKIQVTYGDGEYESVVGHALLRRVPDAILADFHLQSTMTDTTACLTILKTLMPAVGITVLKAVEQHILHLKITELFLTPHANDDDAIKCLGHRIRLAPTKKEIH